MPRRLVLGDNGPMQSHRDPFLDEAEVRAAIERSIGAAPAGLQHLQTKSRRSVYEAALSDGRSVILKADNGSTGEDFRLGLEAWAMAQAASMGMPVPSVLALDLSMQLSPFRFLLMEKAPGVALNQAGLLPEGQRAALRAAGRWLARLHMVAIDGFGTLDEQVYLESGRVTGAFASWEVPTSLRAEAALNFLYGAGALDVEEAAGGMHLIENETTQEPPEARLLHGDLTTRHLFVDPATGVLTSVIDFGDRMGGDPLWDLAIAWVRNPQQANAGEGATEALIEGHEAEMGLQHSRRQFQAYCLMRLVTLARSLHEDARLADFTDIRRRIDALLEDAGLL